MADSPEHIKKHLKLYYLIGGLLFIFTFITVLIAKFDFGAPGIDSVDLIIGLAIAAFKASLVALIFMHLNNEVKLIYKILVFTIVFVIGLFVLSYIHFMDPAVFDGFFLNT